MDFPIATLWIFVLQLSPFFACNKYYNRRHIMELLENERERVSRGGATFSIVMLDIDHFKDVNDTLGHFAGDVVLRKRPPLSAKISAGQIFTVASAERNFSLS